MNARGTSWLAWSLAGVSVAMFAAGAVLALLSLSVAGSAGQPSSSVWGIGGTTIANLLLFAPFLTFPIVGALIASRRPENPIGWICLVAGLFWMLIILGEQSDAYRRAVEPGWAQSTVTLDALTQWTWVLPVGLLGIFMILLFPDGRLPSRRWRPFAWFAGAVIFSICVLMTITPGPLEGHPGVRNPFGLEAHLWIRSVTVAAILLLPACILTSASSLVFRYRSASDVVRGQIRWLAFAASLVGLVYFGILAVELIFVPESLVGNTPPPLWVGILRSTLLLSYAGVPVAVGFAILRHRLYDIDVIINRTLVYGTLTVSLAVIYLGGVASSQYALRTLTGQEQQTQLVIVASTLAIAALFNPLRRRVQVFVDRRFYRKKYDAQKTLGAFGARLRDETDVGMLGEGLIGVVHETLQPEHASLWLRGSREKRREEEARRLEMRENISKGVS